MELKMSHPCIGCKFNNTLFGNNRCKLFSGYLFFAGEIELPEKFLKYYCPCKNCLMKSICLPKKRIHLRHLLREDYTYLLPKDKCALFYNNTLRFIKRENVRNFIGPFIDPLLGDV
jgi:hypothetical protein